jgi:hypothetical protein
MNLLPAIKEHISSHKKVVFSGTDPGTVVTSITVPTTLDSIFASINRFQGLASIEDSSDDGAPYAFSVDRLPKAHKITAGLINNVTFLTKHQNRHRQRQKRGVDEEIRRRKLAKENREREIRTKRAYGKIAAKERRHIRAHAQLPPDAPKPALIHCIGHWSGINSCIKGHSRRGMKKIRAQHRIYGNVAIVNEFNSSKTCPFCFSKVVLHRARRIVGGEERIVRLHGAIECVHPRCPARRIKYTTRGRDANAAANIALSGASIILSSDHQPLPPFRRNANHTRYNLATELLSVVTPEIGSPRLHS